MKKQILKKGFAFALTGIMLLNFGIEANALVGPIDPTGAIDVTPNQLNLNVIDANKNTVNDSSFELYNANNVKIAEWTTGKEANAMCASGIKNVSNVSYEKNTKHTVELDLKKIFGNELVSVKSLRIGNGNTSDTIVSDKKMNDKITKVNAEMIASDNALLAMADCFLDYPTAFTLNANQVKIIDQIGDGMIDYFLSTSNLVDTTRISLPNSGDITMSGIEAREYYLKNNINTKYFSSSDSDGITVGSALYGVDGYAVTNKFNVYNQPTEYFKVTIPLRTIAKYQEIGSGNQIKLLNKCKEYLGVSYLPYGMNQVKVSGVKGSVSAYCGYVFCSGSVVQIPKMDSNGNVTLYIDKNSRSFKFSSFNYTQKTGMELSNGAADYGIVHIIGGTRPVEEWDTYTESKTEKVKFAARSKVGGLTLEGVTAGNYKVVQTQSKGKTINKVITLIKVSYEKGRQEITIKNAETNSASGGTSSNKTPSSSTITKKPSSNTSSALPENPTISDVEKLVFSEDIDAHDKELSPYQNMQLKMTTKEKGARAQVKLTWKRVVGAEGYIIYGARCGKKNKMKRVATVGKSTTKWTNKKLEKGIYYKYIVVAYMGKNVITTSKSVHAVTPGNLDGNPTGIKITGKTKITVKKGKKYKLKAKAICKKRYRGHVAKIRYDVEDNSIATVSAKGVIKGVKKGKTTVYVYAQNGVSKKVSVTVK